jgi:hypothetical protein
LSYFLKKLSSYFKGEIAVWILKVQAKSTRVTLGDYLAFDQVFPSGFFEKQKHIVKERMVANSFEENIQNFSLIKNLLQIILNFILNTKYSKKIHESHFCTKFTQKFNDILPAIPLKNQLIVANKKSNHIIVISIKK